MDFSASISYKSSAIFSNRLSQNSILGYKATALFTNGIYAAVVNVNIFSVKNDIKTNGKFDVFWFNSLLKYLKIIMVKTLC